MMLNKFKLQVSSDLDYEYMVINICWGYELVAILNKEKGADNLEIRFYSPPDDMEYWEFSYNEFLEILDKAKKLLLEE